jgi:hypothetical protein
MTQHDKRSRRSVYRAAVPSLRAVGTSIGASQCEPVRKPSQTLAASAARAPKKTASPRTSGRAAKNVSAMEPTREDLQQKLSEAEARILELEARLSGVADRIAWIADRLHGLLDDDA